MEKSIIRFHNIFFVESAHDYNYSQHKIRVSLVFVCFVRGLTMRISLRWFSQKKGISRVLGCSQILIPACSSPGIRADSPKGQQGKGRDCLPTALAGMLLRFLQKGTREPAAGTAWATRPAHTAWGARPLGRRAPQELPTASPSPLSLPQPLSPWLCTLPCTATAPAGPASRPTRGTMRLATRPSRTPTCLSMCGAKEGILK